MLSLQTRSLHTHLFGVGPPILPAQRSFPSFSWSSTTPHTKQANECKRQKRNLLSIHKQPNNQGGSNMAENDDYYNSGDSSSSTQQP